MKKKILTLMLMLTVIATMTGCGNDENKEEEISTEVVTEEALSTKETKTKEAKETEITEEDHGDYVKLVPVDSRTRDEIGEIPDVEADHSFYENDVEFTKRVDVYLQNGSHCGYIKENGKVPINFKRGDWYGVTFGNSLYYARVSDIDEARVAKVEKTEDTAETTKSASTAASSSGSSADTGASSNNGTPDVNVAPVVEAPAVEVPVVETPEVSPYTRAWSPAEAQADLEAACRAHGLVTYAELVERDIAMGEIDAADRDLVLSWRYEASWFQTRVAIDAHDRGGYPTAYDGHEGYDFVYEREEAGYYIFTCYTY